MALQDEIALLARIPLFSRLEPDALRALALTGQKRVLRNGEVLFKKGDPSDCGYVLLEGMLRLTIAADHLKVVRPPALIGETALLVHTTRPATALACEPCSVLRIPRDVFGRMLVQFAPSATRLRELLLQRMDGLSSETADLMQLLGADAQNIDFRSAAD